jgi:hypothetical protein
MKHVRFIYEHRCPEGMCARQGERVDVYPHIREGVAHLSSIVCVESGCELPLVERVVSG